MRIFISRILDPGSPLKLMEQTHQIELVGESMIHIEPIQVPKLPEADWFFFYSKNGVECFAQQWIEKWKSSTSQPILWAAMGQGTAAAMTGWGMHCDFVGQGDTEDIAEQFLEYSKPTESILFFRANHSRDKLYQIISEHRKATSIPIYDNLMLNKQFPNMDIAIFTSSRNAIAFLEHNPVPTRACIAIGKPTQDTLVSLDVAEELIFVAEEPTETAIKDLLLNILSS